MMDIVARRQVLVQLDDAQLRADVAAAEAAVAESERLYNRSRELMDTEALSKATGLVSARLVMEIPVRRVAIRMAHPVLHLHDACAADCERPERVTEVVPGEVLDLGEFQGSVKPVLDVPDRLAGFRAGRVREDVR